VGANKCDQLAKGCLSSEKGTAVPLSPDKNDNKKQFCTRVPQLAKACGVALSDTEADGVWKLRSKLVHAEAFLYGLDTVLPASEHLDLYEKLEAVLRAAVRQCLLDKSFGDRF
jgi:hypothetical protein